MNALTNRRCTNINRPVHELPYLHEEVIEEILIRLPAKSLGRFKCVSRSWNSLIASRRFIKAHSEKSSTNASLTNLKVITILDTAQELPLLSFLRGASAPPVEYSYPTYVEYYSIIIGCCDGLACILIGEMDFIIWNPATKEFTLLPSIVDSDDDDDLVFVTGGFGYDGSTDDYKVFGFLLGDDMESCVAKVYSLKTDSWRSVVDVAIKTDSFISSFGNFFGGKLHWWRTCDVAAEPKLLQWEISTFDLENEEFGLVELPDDLDCGSYRPSVVRALDGSLCMVCHRRGTTQFDVWIKKHESSPWYKMAAALPHHAPDNGVSFMEPLLVGPSGEILFADGHHSDNFYVYHPRDARLSHPQLIDQEEFCGVHVYLESLVSPVPHVRTPRTAGELAKLQRVVERFP